MEDEQGQGMKQKRKNIHSAPKFNVCFPGASIASLELEGTDCSIFLSLGVLAWTYPVPPFTLPAPLIFLWKGACVWLIHLGLLKKITTDTNTHHETGKKIPLPGSRVLAKELEESLCNPNPENCL